MDLENQARIKQLAEQYGNKRLVVVLGAADPDSSELVAETVTTGDPSYAGPLTEVQLGLPVYHILEPEVKAYIPPEVYEEQVALMELALDAEGIATATKKIRDNASAGGQEEGGPLFTGITGDKGARATLELTKETYQKEVLESELPVLVDFWSNRCDKCMDLMPDVERLEQAYSGRVKFGKVDCPKNRRLIASLRVGHMGLRLPGFWFYRDGEVVDKLMGEDVTKEGIIEKLDELIQE